MKLTFSEALQQSTPAFPVGVEVVTTRGIDAGQMCRFAQDLLRDDRIGWISVTDNPGGNPMLPPDYLAGQLADSAKNTVVHLTCKDNNRLALESQLWRYAAEGFCNILALSGDLPAAGYPKCGASVFDFDSAALLAMMRDMNAGLKVPGRRGNIETLPETSFFAGCTVSPFKKNENELVPQYAKLLKKVRAGAGWVIPQLGYDMRKFAEIKRLLQLNNVNIPLIGNVYVLTKTAAKMFNSGRLAGCVVSGSLLAEIEKYAAGADKGKTFFQELAAKQLAVFQGLGFSAGYLGGVAKPEDVFAIIEKLKQFAADDWKMFYKEIRYPQQDEFYYYDENVLTAAQPVPTLRKRTRNVNLFYRFSRCVHALAFNRGHQLYPLMKRIFAFWEQKHCVCKTCMKTVHRIEEMSKHILYGCKDCGDCALPDTAYLCPMSQCSKNMRNGPCGGSLHSRCEADDKDCIWTIAYDRLKYFGDWEAFCNTDVSCADAALQGTSSWANLYADRDHSAVKK
ncbi:MAG: methylenetetrahydrofolate reductase C-terminal domain-containing protein [Planctomycetaceae bacterium]|jgi:methylenetetrahydrofolate reductase (NADPH)|nr:methylenetetrahydrofolate reductase C-terminal domain-containing protein [Planctomycetaceae bacterium]